jgi:hypothetical protein
MVGLLKGVPLMDDRSMAAQWMGGRSKDESSVGMDARLKDLKAMGDWVTDDSSRERAGSLKVTVGSWMGKDGWRHHHLAFRHRRPRVGREHQRASRQSTSRQGKVAWQVLSVS